MRFRTAALLSLLLVIALVVPASAVEEVTPGRAEGPNRYATAAAVAGLAHPAGTTRAIIATDVAAADVLTATPLAGALDAAILLTRPGDLPVETAQALVDLGVNEVTLVGGTFAISEEVSATLAEDYTVRRIAGQNEWDTAVFVAQEIVTAVGTLPELAEGSTVFLSNEERFPDALSSSAAAYAGAVPVLYTSADVLRGEVSFFLEEESVDHVVLLGGVNALSATVESQLRSGGYTTTRLEGPSRVETSLAVADWAAPRFGFDLTTAVLARGDDYPDAVTSGQVAGKTGAPVILTATPTILPATARSWFVDNCPTLEVVQAVGGSDALSVELFNDVIDAAESCGDQTPPDPPTAGPAFRVTPEQAVQAEPATATQFQVRGRFGEAFTGPVDLVLFPCENVVITADGSATFVDADGDGGADGFGFTETGFARIALVNGVDIDDTAVVVNAAPADDGVLTFTIYSAEADCTVPVVIDGDGDGLFNVDSEGNPTEPYGFGVVRFADS